MTTQYRRMVPEKAQDIGAWQPIMQGIAILAVVTNVSKPRLHRVKTSESPKMHEGCCLKKQMFGIF